MKNIKKWILITVAAIIALLLPVMVVIFTGNIKYNLTKFSVEISAPYYEDFSIDYTQIYEVEYVDSLDFGAKIDGFTSNRLVLGKYNNNQFSDYVRYTYAKSAACVILKTDDQTVVINCTTAQKTKTLYEQILDKVHAANGFIMGDGEEI